MIFIHEKDRKALETGSGTMAELFKERARTVTADKALRHGSVIKTQNFSFRVIHTPGHTPGSICLYDKNYKILVSGDTLFDGAVGRTDFPGGDKGNLMNSLYKLANYPINYLLPGHGAIKVSGVNFNIKQLLNFLNTE
jgi:glyoxylase-like metal-dependent hydrolase (beta-lactamase superfamily II)